MLISNHNNTYLMKRMDTFDTVITPVRRNVARKSTSNRPLLNSIIKEPLKQVIRNDFIHDEKIVSKNNYPSYVPHDFQLYFDNNDTISSKRSLIDSSKKKDSCTEAIDKHDENSQYSLLYEESDDEGVNLSGVFCVSDNLAKYLDEGNLSPTTKHDSSDESIDLSRVRNYPVKVEQCRNDQFYVSNKVSSPNKDPEINASKNIKQELISEGINEDNLQSDIVADDSIIPADSITELGTQTKKCLFDPNLESVTCKVKVREEVLVCENVPLKMTILEANFDVDHLENIVEDNSLGDELVSQKDDNAIIGPQVICAMSLGNGDKSELSDMTINSQTADDQKKWLKKNKRVSLKKEPSKTKEIKADNDPTINEKRLTRSQVHVSNNNKRRITRNSMRLNNDSLVTTEDLSPEINENEIIKSPFKNDLIDESQKSINNSNNELTKVPCVSDENPDVHCNQTKEDKTDCKKKNSVDKKGKKDINEGVLLHVEATKETELMRDGKIIKDKEEYLKDIESKIDQNLPVVVEKEFDIQQSLTEEILLDQALRLAHQRTSPRLSKIMKEAILKATVQKPCSKSKQAKNNFNKLEIKSKGNKSPIFQKHNSEEAELSDSILNNSTASESNSDKAISTDSLNDDIDENNETFRNHKKKKTENYVVAPVTKQTNTENTVEPLTIKICRKTNKKKSGFRLSLKKKRSPKKKEGVISKPICSKVVNMDDLSKTFEDILQDDNWCNDDKVSATGSDNFNEENAESTENKNINIKDLDNDKNGLSPTRANIEQSTSSSQIDSVISEESNLEKPVGGNIENEKNNINKDTGNNNELSNVDNSKPSSILKDSSIGNDSSIPVLSEIITSLSDNNSLDSVSSNGIVTDIVSEKNSNLNLDHLSKDCNTDSFNSSKVVCNSLCSTKLSIDESNKLSMTSISKTDLCNESPTSNTQLETDSSDIHPQLESLQNDLQLKNSFARDINKTIASSKILENQYDDQVHQMINTADEIHEQINNKDVSTHQKETLDILKCPLISPSTEIQPKVLPLSIASRDPRLRKSHVRVIVEVSTSSVSSSPGKSDLQQETRIISQVMQNVSKELDCRKDVDSDSEANESQVETDRRKKFKKREVDAELLYKTPLSDLHDMPERTSYSRSIRKRSPPKTDKRDPRTVRRNENNFIQNNDRIPDTYREYHEVNVYSRMTHQETIRNEVVGSPSEFKRNDYFSPDYRAVGHYRLDPHQSEHFHSFRADTDLRQSENYGRNSSTEYVNEVRNTIDFTERVYQNHSDHLRVGYQFKEIEEDYRLSENYPPDCAPPDNNYSRGYKRLSDLNSDHSHHGSPDFREREHVSRERTIERNHTPHNEPSYSRWDYAHKKVEGHFPPELNNEKEEKNLQPDKMTKMWQEERDLIDGPVKSFAKPYYRRKKFSRGEELFERRSSPWDVDNRRYGENERLWARKTDKELIHGPERDTRWDRRGRGKGFRDVREDRSRSPRRDHDRYPGKRSRSPRSFLRTRREASPSPHNSPIVLDSPMSPEPADRYCVLEPTKCLTVPQ